MRCDCTSQARQQPCRAGALETPLASLVGFPQRVSGCRPVRQAPVESFEKTTFAECSEIRTDDSRVRDQFARLQRKNSAVQCSGTRQVAVGEELFNEDCIAAAPDLAIRAFDLARGFD